MASQAQTQFPGPVNVTVPPASSRDQRRQKRAAPKPFFNINNNRSSATSGARPTAVNNGAGSSGVRAIPTSRVRSSSENSSENVTRPGNDTRIPKTSESRSSRATSDPNTGTNNLIPRTHEAEAVVTGSNTTETTTLASATTVPTAVTMTTNSTAVVTSSMIPADSGTSSVESNNVDTESQGSSVVPVLAASAATSNNAISAAGRAVSVHSSSDSMTTSPSIATQGQDSNVFVSNTVNGQNSSSVSRTLTSVNTLHSNASDNTINAAAVSTASSSSSQSPPRSSATIFIPDREAVPGRMREVGHHASTSNRWSSNSDHAVIVDDQRRLLSSSLDAINSSSTDNTVRRPQSVIEQTVVQSRNASPGVTRIERPRSTGNVLPDILNSHIPPPYSPARQGQTGRENRNNRPSVTPRRTHRHERHGRSRHSRSRSRRHRRRTSSRSSQTLPESEKDCCSGRLCRSCLTSATKFRWVLISLSLLGVCCVVTGIVLGALHKPGTSFLTLSLMFIGLGVMLVIVVVVGWRCTPPDHEPCHLLFGLGQYYAEAEREIERLQAEMQRERQPQWFGGVMYQEFRYRRPPPSYNASMQDYQQQIMVAQLQNVDQPPGDSLPSSPPPTYRSQASVRPGINMFPSTGDDYPSSRPPTYRSHISTVGHGAHSRPALIMDAPSDLDILANNGTQTADSVPGVDTSQIVIDIPNTEATNQGNSAEITGTVTSLSNVTSSDANNDHVITLTLGDERPQELSSPSDTNTEPRDNLPIGESTMHRGFRLVESLESMLDDTLRIMDQGNPTEESNVNIHITSM